MADRFQVSIEQALAALDGLGPIWFRIAAVLRSGEWQASVFEVTSGVAPPGWEAREWRYDEAVFIAGQTSGSIVRQWFEAAEADVTDVPVKLPPLQPTINCEHRSSRQQYIYDTLEWPCLVYDFGQWAGVNTQPPEPLIADGAPSFLTHAKAASSFFGVDMGSGGLADRPAHVRAQDLTGRIVSVVVGVTEVAVSIEGTMVRDALVELASDIEGPTELLNHEGPQEVSFPLAGPPPPNGWVVLRRGSTWIDRKFLRTIHTLNADPGVEYQVEPETEVRSLIAQGETSMIEFKSRLPVKGDRKYRLEIARAVAAFSNQEGGWLLIGVANDGTVDGVIVPDTMDESQVAIVNLIKDLVTPLADFDVEAYAIDGQQVIVVTVSPGPTPPYGVEPANPTYYVRRGGTTFPASAEAVRQLARSRPPAELPPPYGFRGL